FHFALTCAVGHVGSVAPAFDIGRHDLVDTGAYFLDAGMRSGVLGLVQRAKRLRNGLTGAHVALLMRWLARTGLASSRCIAVHRTSKSSMRGAAVSSTKRS